MHEPAPIAASPAARQAQAVRTAFTRVLLPAAALCAGALGSMSFVHDARLRTVLDNVHWTVSYSAAAWLAWIGVSVADAGTVRTRRWFAWGLSAYAAGQVLWDIQVAAGWNPFPGPSDALYLLLGPAVAAGLIEAMRARISGGVLRSAMLDAGAFTVASIALILALYLPLRHDSSLLQLTVLVLYPVGMFAAAGLAFMVFLTLRLRPAFGSVLLFAAMSANGLLWLRWNALTLSNALGTGTLFNACFSAAALAAGVAAMTWDATAIRTQRWKQHMQSALHALPTLVVIAAAAAVTIVNAQPTSALVTACATYGAGLVIVLALARQHLMFREEARLRDAESQFHTLFESATDGILVMDGPRFVACNAAAERMFRMSREELCRLTPMDLSPERQADGARTAERAPQILERAFAGESQLFPWNHRRADGTVFEAEVRLDRVQLPTGNLLQAVVRDVTERNAAERQRQLLEEQLRHSSRLEAVGRLAGGVAHDFNNILTVILGMTDLAQSRPSVDEQLGRDLDEIRHSAKRAARLTSQLLAFSRRQVITPLPCDLDQLVEGSLQMLQPLLGEDIELSLTCSEGESTVLADPTQIEQVLINLAVNARDAMPLGGRLEIETFPFHVSEDRARAAGVQPGPYRCLQVRDHGTGIAPELMEHVFEPFFTTKELGRGTGLGLATTYGIVHQSGGFIDLISQVGAGTTFRVYLPLIDAAAVAAPAVESHAAEPQGGSQHILLVEDEPSVRELTKRLMEAQGYRVTAAESGEQALALVDSSALTFDLLITDVILTGMSGRELQERLRERITGLRVVYMSGYTDNIIAPHGVLEPGTCFVQKPFTSAAIGATVREALQAPTKLAA